MGLSRYPSENRRKNGGRCWKISAGSSASARVQVQLQADSKVSRTVPAEREREVQDAVRDEIRITHGGKCKLSSAIAEGVTTHDAGWQKRGKK